MSSLMRPTVNQHRYGLIICGDGRPSASGNFAGQGPKKDGAPVPGTMQDLNHQKKCEKFQFYRHFYALTLSPITVAKPLSPAAAASYLRAMTRTRLRQGSYLFQRGSIWWIRLRSPAGRTEKSLRTADKREAELAALPLVATHKAALLAAKPRVESEWRREFEPGIHVGLNGENIYATLDQLHFLDEVPVRIEPNGVMVHRLVARGPLSAHTEFSMLDAAHGEALPPRPKAPAKNGDDAAILDTYLNHRNLAGRFRAEAEATWATYKRLTNSKALRDATRDDGRLLVKHFIDAGNKTATVGKKVGWLRAAVQLAIDEGKMTFNPFARIVSDGNDEVRRKPLTEDAMAPCKQHFV